MNELAETRRRLALRGALARYYKQQRDRAENCLGDIIVLLEQDGDPTERILDRLAEHYSDGGG